VPAALLTDLHHEKDNISGGGQQGSESFHTSSKNLEIRIMNFFSRFG
jgi:hypothetical protein